MRKNTSKQQDLNYTERKAALESRSQVAEEMTKNAALGSQITELQEKLLNSDKIVEPVTTSQSLTQENSAAGQEEQSFPPLQVKPLEPAASSSAKGGEPKVQL